MRSLLMLIIAVLSAGSFAASEKLTLDEAKALGGCRYDTDPVVFHVVDRSGVQYDICFSVVTCRVAGKSHRYSFRDLAPSSGTCATFEQAYRRMKKNARDETIYDIDNVGIHPDSSEVVMEKDGSECSIEDRPEFYMDKVNGTWTGNCFAHKVCKKNGKREETPIACQPVPEEKWPSVDGTRRPLCPTLSVCSKGKFSPTDARIVDLNESAEARTASTSTKPSPEHTR